MIGSIQHVLDYMKCPMAYKFRYIDAINPSTRKITEEKYDEPSMEELFDKEIHKLGYHIFNYIQDDKYPTEYLLRQKWATTWCRNKTMQDVIFESNAKNSTTILKRLEKTGLKVIENMHPRFKKDPGVPILVGKTAELRIGKHILTVTIDLVREIEVNGEKIIEIVDFKTGLQSRKKSNDQPLNLHIGRDIEVTAVSLAFQQLTGHQEDRITYYDMINDREYRTKRTKKDHQLLLDVLNQVEKGIVSEVYYPVMDHRCFDCPFQVTCRRENWYK